MSAGRNAHAGFRHCRRATRPTACGLGRSAARLGQAGDVGEQRAQRRRRRGDQPRDPRGLAVRLEEGLAQVDQVALGLALRSRGARPRPGSTCPETGRRRARRRSPRESMVYSSGKMSTVRPSSPEASISGTAVPRWCQLSVMRQAGRRDRGSQVRPRWRTSAPSRRPGCPGTRRATAAAGRRCGRGRAPARRWRCCCAAEKCGISDYIGRHGTIGCSMQLRTFNIGCFGGGTGLPSLLGGLKSNPWLTVNAVVTMFDSGGSSGVLRDQLGVLPPGDVLKCALALARNEREARRVLLARLPTLEHQRLGGHTGGNLLLSMMQQYSGDFLAAVDGLRELLGCARARVAGQHRAGERLRGVPRRQRHARRSRSRRGAQRRPRRRPACGWNPRSRILPAAATAIAQFRGGVDRAGQLLYQPDADFPREGRAGGDPAGQRARSCS